MSCGGSPVWLGLAWEAQCSHQCLFLQLEDSILFANKIRVLFTGLPLTCRPVAEIGGDVGGGGGFFTKGGAAVKDLPIKFQSRDDVTRDHQGELPTMNIPPLGSLASLCLAMNPGSSAHKFWAARFFFFRSRQSFN